MMSTKISKKRFIEMLRKIIRQEIDEASTSANVPGYMTPNAFSGKGKMDRRDSVASGSGFQKVEEQESVNEAKDPDIIAKLNVIEIKSIDGVVPLFGFEIEVKFIVIKVKSASSPLCISLLYCKKL